MGNNSSIDGIVACGSSQIYSSEGKSLPYEPTRPETIGSRPYAIIPSRESGTEDRFKNVSIVGSAPETRYNRVSMHLAEPIPMTNPPPGLYEPISEVSHSKQSQTTSIVTKYPVLTSGRTAVTSGMVLLTSNVASPAINTTLQKAGIVSSFQRTREDDPIQERNAASVMSYERPIMTSQKPVSDSSQPPWIKKRPSSAAPLSSKRHVELPATSNHTPMITDGKIALLSDGLNSRPQKLNDAQSEWQAILGQYSVSSHYEDISTNQTRSYSKVKSDEGQTPSGSSGSTGQLNEPSSPLTNSAPLFRSNPALNLGDNDSNNSRSTPVRPLPPIPGSPKSSQSRASPRLASRPHLLNGSNVCLSDSESERGVLTRRQADELRDEVAFLRKQLAQSQETVARLQAREKTLQDRLSEQAQRHFDKESTKFENLNLGENRPTALVRRYGNLYSEVRLDTFDALDDLPEIADFDDLKGKLLFSVVVLAFRSVQRALADLRQRIRDLLCLPSPDASKSKASKPPAELEPLVTELEQLIGVYMRKSIDTYDISRSVQEVSNQVYATLYDYPTLRECDGLRSYIKECVHISWALSVQNPPFVISYDSKIFSEAMHTRFHTSDPESDVIRSVLWPALLEGDNGACVFKGVVIT